MSLSQVECSLCRRVLNNDHVLLACTSRISRLLQASQIPTVLKSDVGQLRCVPGASQDLNLQLAACKPLASETSLAARVRPDVLQARGCRTKSSRKWVAVSVSSLSNWLKSTAHSVQRASALHGHVKACQGTSQGSRSTSPLTSLLRVQFSFRSSFRRDLLPAVAWR